MTSVSTILNFEIYNFKTAKQTSRLNKSDFFVFSQCSYQAEQVKSTF